MELRGRGRGDGCGEGWEPGSRNDGSDGRGQKGRQERENAGLSSALGMEGGMKMYGECCGAQSVTFTKCVAFRLVTEGERVARGEEAKMDTTGKKIT